MLKRSLFMLWMPALLALALLACTRSKPPLPNWRSGELVVIVPPQKSGADAAFEMQLATRFAQELHLKLKPLPLAAHQILPALQNHQAHFAAAGLRHDASNLLRFGKHYQTMNEQVVCMGEPPHRIADIAGRLISVVAGSPQDAALRAMQSKLPALRWHVSETKMQAELLQEVADGKLECTVANEEQIALARNYHPELGATLDLNSPSHLAWAFALDGDAELFTQAEKFFTHIQKDGTLQHLLDQYYGHNDRLESVDAVQFVSDIEHVLPRFRALFEEASTLSGIEWELLAALAYQESHWNPIATSPTNVRGMMMLTEETADLMGVKDRLNPRESIVAGARYLQMMREQLPPRLDDAQRTWLALAAYNQGMGHLEDARVLAKKSGLNPDVWADVKTVMPLLGQEAYAAEAKHGAARGGEAVILVETVRLYSEMIKRLTKQKKARPMARLGLFELPLEESK